MNCFQEKDLKYMVDEPTEYHHKRYCYKFVMDRVGGESVNRHRGIKGGVSRAQESTRYCNYNGKKFGGEILISLPSKFYELINNWSVENPDILRRIIKETGAKSTDHLINEDVDELCDKCVDFSKAWAPVAKELWDNNTHPVTHTQYYRDTEEGKKK